MKPDQATPSQLAAHEAHKARVRRLFQPPRSPMPQPVGAPAAAPPPRPAVPEKSWEDRQREIPMPRPAWFAIVGEMPLPQPKNPTVEQIIRACAAHFKVTMIDIKSPRRTADVVRPRQVAMYLAKQLTMKSLPDIGRRFGGRDHTTVLHAVRKIGAMVHRDADVAFEVAHIEAAFGVEV